MYGEGVTVSWNIFNAALIFLFIKYISLIWKERLFGTHVLFMVVPFICTRFYPKIPRPSHFVPLMNHIYCTYFKTATVNGL